MSVRPGRLLPSVIVGALLTGAMALGAGTASADETITREQCDASNGTLSMGGLACTIGDTTYTILSTVTEPDIPPTTVPTSVASQPDAQQQADDAAAQAERDAAAARERDRQRALA